MRPASAQAIAIADSSGDETSPAMTVIDKKPRIKTTELYAQPPLLSLRGNTGGFKGVEVPERTGYNPACPPLQELLAVKRQCVTSGGHQLSVVIEGVFALSKNEFEPESLKLAEAQRPGFNTR